MRPERCPITIERRASPLLSLFLFFSKHSIRPATPIDPASTDSASFGVVMRVREWQQFLRSQDSGARPPPAQSLCLELALLHQLVHQLVPPASLGCPTSRGCEAALVVRYQPRRLGACLELGMARRYVLPRHCTLTLCVGKALEDGLCGLYAARATNLAVSEHMPEPTQRRKGNGSFDVK